MQSSQPRRPKRFLLTEITEPEAPQPAAKPSAPSPAPKRKRLFWFWRLLGAALASISLLLLIAALIKSVELRSMKPLFFLGKQLTESVAIIWSAIRYIS